METASLNRKYDDDPTDNDCAAEVELEVVVEVLQETALVDEVAGGDVPSGSVCPSKVCRKE